MELVGESQRKITVLTHKYNDLCKTSGLKPKKQRMSVSGYVRTKVNLSNYKIFKEDINKFNEIGEKYFNFKSNDELNEYVTQGNNVFSKMQKDKQYENKMYDLANKIDKLKEPISENIVLFSAQDKDFDLTTSNFTLSTTISKDIANLYKINNRKNRELVTIYAEQGSKLISTFNTKNRQFDKQGELIIPISELKKLKRINKYTYLFRK